MTRHTLTGAHAVLALALVGGGLTAATIAPAVHASVTGASAVAQRHIDALNEGAVPLPPGHALADVDDVVASLTSAATTAAPVTSVHTTVDPGGLLATSTVVLDAPASAALAASGAISADPTHVVLDVRAAEGTAEIVVSTALTPKAS